jgi:hypothetical protein
MPLREGSAYSMAPAFGEEPHQLALKMTPDRRDFGGGHLSYPVTGSGSRGGSPQGFAVRTDLRDVVTTWDQGGAPGQASPGTNLYQAGAYEGTVDADGRPMSRGPTNSFGFADFNPQDESLV